MECKGLGEELDLPKKGKQNKIIMDGWGWEIQQEDQTGRGNKNGDKEGNMWRNS